MPEDAWVLRAPRLNANDDSVTLTRWLVADRATVAARQAVAEIETEKATAEVAAEAGGILVQAVAAGAMAAIGAPLGFVAPTLAAAEAARQSQLAARDADSSSPIGATVKARALAQARGVDLASVRASGATIKERDVARHLAEHGSRGNDATREARLVRVGEASAHRRRVARDLRAAAQAGVFTTLAYRLDLRGPERMIAAELAQGRTASLLVTLLWGLGRTLPAFAQLLCVLDRGEIYRHRELDIAFAARSAAGELFAPAVRGVDRLSLEAIARECARLAKAVLRGKLDAKDAGGAAFTVSLIATPNVESFVALPPPSQAAILALAAARREVDPADGVAREVATMTVTYDHALCDGVYVAEFCAALDRVLNPEQA